MARKQGVGVLLVGFRSAAIRAARRLGYVPLVLDHRLRTAGATPPRGGSSEGNCDRIRVDLGSPLPVLQEAAGRLVAQVPPRAVVPMVEAAVSVSARLRAFLGVPGASEETADACHDKLLMKRRVRERGIACADFIPIDQCLLPEACREVAGELVGRLGLPLVLKPRSSSGGRGYRLAGSHAEASRLVGPGDLAERFVVGSEMSVETMLRDGAVIFRNRTHYLEPGWASLLPAPMTPEEAAEVDCIVDAVHQALGIETGMSHIEIFRTQSGPVFGEIAVRPPGGCLMELLEIAYGFDPWEALLRLELGDPPNLPPEARCFAAARMLHPGAGRLVSLRGLDRARMIPGIRRIRWGTLEGETVETRLGTGQNVGEIVACGPTGEACEATLRQAQEAISAVMEATRVSLAPEGPGAGGGLT